MATLLFVAAAVGRRLNIDPERALHRANAKFVRRFNAVEAALDYQLGNRRDFSELSAAWNAVKRAEKAQQAAAAGG